MAWVKLTSTTKNETAYYNTGNLIEVSKYNDTTRLTAIVESSRDQGFAPKNFYVVESIDEVMLKINEAENKVLK